MSIYWPIAVVVVSNVFYHICAKSMPGSVSPFASLTITYIIAGIASAGMFFLFTPNGSLLREYRLLNWTSLALGIAIVGLEIGTIYMYKIGWEINTGHMVQSVFLAIALLLTGLLLYKEVITWTKVLGVAICILGVYFINK